MFFFTLAACRPPRRTGRPTKPSLTADLRALSARDKVMVALGLVAVAAAVAAAWALGVYLGC